MKLPHNTYKWLGTAGREYTPLLRHAPITGTPLLRRTAGRQRRKPLLRRTAGRQRSSRWRVRGFCPLTEVLQTFHHELPYHPEYGYLQEGNVRWAYMGLILHLLRHVAGTRGPLATQFTMFCMVLNI